MDTKLNESNVAELDFELVEDDTGELTSGPPGAGQDHTAAPPPPRTSAPMPPWRGAHAPAPAPAQAGASVETDEEGHRIVMIDDEAFTVVEGDLVLDVDQKNLWQEARAARQIAAESQARLEAVGLRQLAPAGLAGEGATLVGIVQGGKLVRWSPHTVLSYCVLRNTFPREEWYEEVVTNMHLATQAWEAVCGVRFEYRAEIDASSAVRPDGVLFPVRFIGAGGAFIAAAFFPNDPASRRRVLIDPSYFSTSFDRVGVLRHELGHVIGFRHEHIRSGAPAVWPPHATSGTLDLTAYDPHSVMHYFCGGVGSRKLDMTQVDVQGAQKLYGQPLSDYELLQA